MIAFPVLSAAYPRRRAALAICCAVLAVPALAVAAETRAIVIGVDRYEHAPPLRGAVADARDLEAVLRGRGARDLAVLVDSSVDRAAVSRAMEALLARAQKGDTIFLTLAGYGALEPGQAKGAEHDEPAFLLPKYDRRDARKSGEKIPRAELDRFIDAAETKGARVFLVADASFGVGLSRAVDPRAAALVYRSLSDRPIATGEDSARARRDFERSVVLEAADPRSKAPEVEIAGAGYRGALSYAVARALEGAGDADGDGRVTTEELIAYVRQFTYQLSDQRQAIVALRPRALDASKDVIAQHAAPLGRGVGVQAVGAPPAGEEEDSAPAGGGLTITPLTPKSMAIGPGQSLPPAKPAALPPRPKEPIRLAVRGAAAERGMGAGAHAPFVLVGADAAADIVWDAASRDALAGGDVLAHNVDAHELDVLIDRAATVRWLKLVAGKGPLPMRVSPEGLHRKGQRVEIVIGGVAGRNLLLFDLTGDGVLQLLYPLPTDPPVVQSSEYRLTVVAGEPFGADQIVAIASTRAMPQLETALRQLDRLRDPAKVVDIIAQFASGDAQLGAVAIVTTR
ncbi:MAG TPA: caspase family protein [Methylosinus sp.]|uniref:caspase family protein n=1 Tax=Methylosinus sp. TaxID=427 RepID=UPI002F948C0F